MQGRSRVRSTLYVSAFSVCILHLLARDFGAPWVATSPVAQEDGGKMVLDGGPLDLSISIITELFLLSFYKLDQ